MFHCCFQKYTTEQTILGFKKKVFLNLFFQFGKQENKKNGSFAPKIINELPAPTKKVLVTYMLSKAKNPKDYQKREVNEFEQAPLYFEKSDHTSAFIATVPKYRMTTETVKKEKGN